MLRAKLLGDWESLEFMKDFWNPEYDERDILQYRRFVPVWRMRESEHRTRQSPPNLEKTRGSAARSSRGRTAVLT